ncbi:MAG: class E sortase [Acidimicrobiales bacterium]
MTALLRRARPSVEPALVEDPPAASGPNAAPTEPPSRPSSRRLRRLLGLWVVATLGGMILVVYGFGPFLQQRAQRSMLSSYRGDIERSVNEASGLPGVSASSKPPATGAPVGIVEIGSVRMQQVVVEGVGAAQTRSGPGHVPGTAGPGQPGNSVVVGRAKAFGGPFGRLHDLHVDDEILLSSTQGQSVYAITEVRSTDMSKDGQHADDLYGPSDDDRLTLVTSDSALPWNHSNATVVVATLRTKAFVPTAQGARSDDQTGLTGDAGSRATVVLALLAYGAAMGASVLLYRSLRPRTAYLLTMAPIVALTIVAAESLSRLFPAWM